MATSFGGAVKLVARPKWTGKRGDPELGVEIRGEELIGSPPR